MAKRGARSARGKYYRSDARSRYTPSHGYVQHFIELPSYHLHQRLFRVYNKTTSFEMKLSFDSAAAAVQEEVPSYDMDRDGGQGTVTATTVCNLNFR